MADISAELAAIKSAVYGEEVRGSIHNGLQKMNTDLNYAIGRQVLTVDNTLSVTGAAAEAKVTGTKLEQALYLGALTSATAINGENDLDTLSPGNYYCSSSQKPAHSPTSTTYRLIITYRNTTSSYFAFLFDAYGDMYIRTRAADGTWKAWKKLASEEDVQETESKLSEALYLGTLESSTQLTSTDDLNTLEPGNYYCGSNPKPANSPSSATFRLIIMYRNTTGSYYAVLMDANSDMFVRTRAADGTWKTWRKLADEDAINSKVAEALFLGNLTSSTQLTAENDLNALEPGNYYCGSSTKPANSPTTATFRLIVVYRNTTSSYFAVLMDANSDVFVRTRASDGVWKTWRKLADEAAFADLSTRVTDSLLNENCFNYLNSYTLQGGVSAGGITWTVNSDRSVTVSGTATSTCILNFGTAGGPLPQGMTAGATYRLDYSSLNVDFRVLVLRNGATSNSENVFSYLESPTDTSDITIDSNVTGITFRLAVSSGVTVNETVKPVLHKVPTNAQLGDIPKPYYLTEIKNTIRDAQNAITGPGLVFFVCSDLHYKSRLGVYPTTIPKFDSVTDMCQNMRAVLKQVSADALVCLGDVVDSYNWTTSETIEQTRYVMEQLKGVGLPMIYALGNHDDNRYISGEYFSPEQIYSLFINHVIPDRVSDMTMNGLNYYIDYPIYNIRCLVVDGSYQNSSDGNVWHYGFSTKTLTWFRTQLNNVPSGWSVLVFTHRGFVTGNNVGLADVTNQANMRSAISTFIQNGGNYIATIYGHSHVDYSNSSPWLEITMGSAKVHNSAIDNTYPTGSVRPTRTKGTATEDLWDILVIQPSNRTIKTIRFGAGSNRSWTY